MAQLKITLKKSTIGCPHDQKATVIKPDNPAIRGQIFKVKHLLSVEEV